MSDDTPLKVVVIGGGTGNSTVLGGLKHRIGHHLTAVVNTFDDGGGTGKIRDEYGGIAVGDLRQCARAMSDLSADALAVLEGRYGKGTGLSDMNVHGQTVGNLLLHQAIHQFRGDYVRAIHAYSEIYRIRGNVLPVSHDSRRLRLTTVDGILIEGEHEAEMTDIASLKGAEISFDGEASISEAAKEAISEADMVVLAPGDLYTSIAPNLAVEGMREALEQAKLVVMVANLMNRARHTAGFTALDYAREYERIIGARVIGRVLYNIAPLDSQALRDQLEAYGSHPVVPDEAGLREAGYRPVARDLLSAERPEFDVNDALADTRSNIRHDPRKVADALVQVASQSDHA